MDKRFFSWNIGENQPLFRFFGCHPQEDGVVFRVCAPEAAEVFVTGAFCQWDPLKNPMTPIAPGIYEASIQGIRNFDAYKYVIRTGDGRLIFKSDPFALHAETPPGNASKVYFPEERNRNDSRWLSRRQTPEPKPVNLYEVHAGTFRTYASGEPLNYRTLANELSAYVKDMGYTGVCLLPILEHINDSDGGYRTTSFFAPTSRYGTPDDFWDFVSVFHQADLSVWLEWPAEGFPADDFGLSDFSGIPCFEAPDDVEKPDFRRFDYENPSVRRFLIDSARFLLETSHADGIRVCGGSRIADRPGGLAFLKELNAALLSEFPGIRTAGSAPDAGFSLLLEEAPVDALLSVSSGEPPASPLFPPGASLLSADHHLLWEKESTLMGQMTGSYEEKFAKLRALVTVLYGASGKKLLFMGNEFAQFSPWNAEHELDWMLLDYEMHRKFQNFTRQLNDFYRKAPAMWGEDFTPIPFPEQPLLLAFSRKDPAGNEFFTLANFTNEEIPLQMGVERRGKYTELFSTDELKYGGQGRLNSAAFARLHSAQGKPFCAEALLPPLTAIYLYKAAGLPRKENPASQ